MNRKLLAYALTVSCGFLGALETPAQARTIPASIGYPRSTFAEGVRLVAGAAVGVVTSWGDTVQDWVVPLPIDVPGSKTIKIIGRSAVTNGIRCFAYAIDPVTGVMTSTTSVNAIPVQTSGFTYITLTLSNVPVGAFASVNCSFSASNTSNMLVGVDYNP